MNFDTFMKKYGIEAYTSAIVMERDTLIEMLNDMYSEAYNDAVELYQGNGQ